MTAFQCRDMAIAAAEPGREHEKQLQNRWRTGRPRFYDSPQQMQEAIDTYFEQEESPTICGLALALGFNSRQSLLDYGREFLDSKKERELLIITTLFDINLEFYGFPEAQNWQTIALANS